MYLLILVLIVLAFLVLRKKYKKSSDTNKSFKSNSSSSQQVVNSLPSDEELMSDDHFQTALSYFRRYWHCMALANGNRRCLKEPTILFGIKDITLIKYAGEISRKNIDAYRNGTVSEKKETALEKFAKELFGEYAEGAKKIIDIETVADDLIELEPDGEWRYDVTLRVTWPSTINDKRAQELFRRELSKTKIFD